ncbi:hypothetical protein N7488_012284 [Penicillium malachiteum]|nr:hypothetical protein N7488_012284 [Penicillium malachiteum]
MFRLQAAGLTIFHDTWLDRPSLMPKWLDINSVTEADYIITSHAHFDHLPGADKIALNTGAIIIANCEAINRLRDAGVPDDQLVPVSGGERIPLFTKYVRAAAKSGQVALSAGPPGAPAGPYYSLAIADIYVWPSLHCLITSTHDTLPDTFDSGADHLGAYKGIVKDIQPKPDIAVLGIAGRANLNGRPFDGSAAMFATKLAKWMGEPEKVI